MRRRFFVRFAPFVLLMLAGLVAVASLIVWLVASLLGAQASTIFLGLLVLLVVAIVARGLVRAVRGSAEPIVDLVEAAERLEAGDYAARVRERGPREVRSLVRAFNAMAERLAETDEQRRRLLADISHELRTPLAVMQGNLEAILDGVYPADAAHLEPIVEETRVLERLIEDLRTLALAEAGALRLHREAVDVTAMLADVVAGFDSRAAEAGVALRADGPGGLPTVEADPARIRQVVSNLVVNALEHTPRGGRVELAASRAAEGVSVTVTDTGNGIDPELLPRIFDRFQRAPDSPGSGLGLAIARDLVEAHGGRINAASEPGSGTTVTFTLPAAQTLTG